MRELLLIARREYVERIRARSFMVMTILIPALMGGGLFASIYFGMRSVQRSAHITIVSPDTALALSVQSALATSDPALTVDVISPPTADTRHILTGDVDDRETEGFLWLDAAAAQPAVFFGHPTIAHLAEFNAAVRQSTLHATIVVKPIHPPKPQTESVSAGESAKIIAGFFFFLMYMAVMFYGVNVARSITEEKTSRVFEVMLATVTPQQMMAGKVIGVGGVGVTQVFIWIAAAALLVLSPLVPMLTGIRVPIAISPWQLLFFVLMFVLGFTLYASVAAILGAIVNSEQELSQLNMILAMPLAACMFIIAPILSNPDGHLALLASLVPCWTPLIMFARVSVGHPPLWQIALSVVDLIVAIYIMMWIASRIYRIGILMYGKRPTLGEILRWMRYS